MRRKSRLNLLDTIGEVLMVYGSLIVGCTIIVGALERWSEVDALWWAVVTVSTTGYGDLAPKTGLGRLVAAGLMIGAWVLNIVLAGLVAARLIVDNDAWTHEEQEEVKRGLAQLLERDGGPPG